MKENNIDKLISSVNILVSEQKKEKQLKMQDMFTKKEDINDAILNETIKTNDLLEELKKENSKKSKDKEESLLTKLTKNLPTILGAGGLMGYLFSGNTNMLNRLFAPLGTMLLDSLMNGIKMLSTPIEFLVKKIGNLASGLFDNILKTTSTMFDSVLKGVGSIFDGIFKNPIFKKLFPSVGKMAGKITENVGKLGGAIGKGAKFTGKMAGKAGKAGKAFSKVAKLAPGAGLIIGGGLSIDRALKGDYVGAGLELASGAISTIPGGGLVSAGIDTYTLARDIKRSYTGEVDQEKAGLFERVGQLFKGGGLNIKRGVNVSDLQPDVLANLQAMGEEYYKLTGEQIDVNSGYRSLEKQTELWNKALKKYGSPEKARKWVAPPGSSMHNFGYAFDIQSSDTSKLQSLGLLKKYGFHLPISREKWHIEPSGINRTAIKQNQTSEEPNENQVGDATLIQNDNMNRPSTPIQKKESKMYLDKIDSLIESISKLPKQIAKETISLMPSPNNMLSISTPSRG